MSDQEKLGYYYKQLDVVENRLINAKKEGDIPSILLWESEKEKIQFAVNWLESQ
jgi:hypothetical protein